MHLHFEQNISSRTECTIHSLSWMGKVPDLVTNGSGETQGATPRRPTRTQYYSEGWLASGNAKGIVGVTFTASHCRKYDPPNRSNFNLRGHRAEVTLVRWNEPYQKLATCDTQGIIFVWIKHEGRWSIELINDRNSQVTDFAWSHDGNMALICYCDGFVLVGSVAGHRYWSSVLNLDNTCITCGVWSPDDQKVMFGTTDGQIIVMSSTGAMITQITILDGMEITSLLWSCEKFKMEENSRKDSVVTVASDSGELLDIMQDIDYH
ncbi:TULP4-like protein [Mya arenaria]|uniref:TULP4-like protein n=1 Tax=Mya arenaria TaxID=6604 RepID=A0ABY7EL05_MYAAR|nr:TULP4-like protein [Mya arenaria]WAR09472.1 TULP4-like protein [Mya arenaria]